MDTSQQTALPTAESFLYGLGCQLLQTESAQEARRIMSVMRLSGIVLDVSGSPEKALPQIKELAAINSNRTGIIVISSAMDITTAQQLFRYGAVDVLLKPVPANRLKSAVQAACSKAEERGQVEGGKHVILLVQCADKIIQEIPEEQNESDPLIA